MASSSALPKAKAKAKVRARRTAKYDHLPKDLRGAAKFLDEKNLIANINKAMNRDGRVEVPLPRGDDPAHVGRVLGDIVRRIDRSAGRSTRRSSSPSTASESTNARIGRTMRRVHARMDDDDVGRPRIREPERSVHPSDSESMARRRAGLAAYEGRRSAPAIQYGGSSASTDPLGLFS